MFLHCQLLFPRMSSLVYCMEGKNIRFMIKKKGYWLTARNPNKHINPKKDKFKKRTTQIEVKTKLS